MNSAITFRSTLPLERHAKGLRNKFYTFIEGSQFARSIHCTEEDTHNFIHEWDQLVVDSYMGDGGRYRYRRYGQFHKSSGSNQFILLPHEPYVQSQAVNPLNGGIPRNFEPLTNTFVQSPILQRTLETMTELYDSTYCHPCDWNIILHPYRIVASPMTVGQPSPEGLHRDGVTFIASMMIKKSGASGGVTTLTDNHKQPITSIELSNRFDILMSDDAKTMHDVSPIEADGCCFGCYRDVLVIAFTHEDNK